MNDENEKTPDPREPSDPSPGKEGAGEPEECTCDHAPEDLSAHGHEPGCPCCNGGREPTEEELAALESDAAGASLARALSFSFRLLKLVMIAILFFFLVDCVTFVEQGEVGLVRRFGGYLRNEDGTIRTFRAGALVFVWPEPIETLVRIPSGAEKTLALDEQFWPQVDKAKRIDPEQGELPAEEMLDPARSGYNLTGDLNIVHSRWLVHYRIRDPERYVLAARDPEEVVRRIGLEVIERNIAGVSVDDALTRRTGALFDRIRDEIQGAVLDDAGRPRWGIEVTTVSNDRLLPPGKTQQAFNQVTSALSTRKEKIEKARGEADKLLEEGKAMAHRIRTEAGTYRIRVRETARADAQRLSDLLQKFPGDPAGLHVYLQQYRQDVIREVLANTQRYIIRPGEAWFYTSAAPGQQIEPEKKKR